MYPTRTPPQYRGGIAYSPEELSLFRMVFDECEMTLPPSLRTSANRSLLANRILECAATGERDSGVLVAAALKDFEHYAAITARYQKTG